MSETVCMYVCMGVSVCVSVSETKSEQESNKSRQMNECEYPMLLTLILEVLSYLLRLDYLYLKTPWNTRSTVSPRDLDPCGCSPSSTCFYIFFTFFSKFYIENRFNTWS